MWTNVPMITFAAQLGQGVGLQSVFTFAGGFGPLAYWYSGSGERTLAQPSGSQS
jgi:hypothetical protein